MRLYELKINGFRKLKDVTVKFGDATWLLGPNNCGKSSVLKAIQYLLSAQNKILEPEWCSEADEKTGEPNICVENIILEAEFRNVPAAADGWRGFKGRVFRYEPEAEDDTGRAIYYRKIYTLGKNAEIAMKSRLRKIKGEFANAKTAQDLVDLGASEEQVKAVFPKLDANLSAKDKEKIALIDDACDLDDEVVWDNNPGGIAGVVLSRLPRFLLIPATTSSDEITEKTGVLQETLNELFKDVREISPHYKVAQDALNLLAKELDPTDETSEFGRLMGELNKVLADVFPNGSIHASANLSDPNTALRPAFDVAMESNIRTGVDLQGTGMVRSAVFGLLRYRQKWLSQREDAEERSIIIGFEEPEIYLHPSAANQMRNVIYDLSSKASQIVATTHSPYMIDLSRKPRQVLNRVIADDKFSSSTPFSVSDAYKALLHDHKTHVKMLLKIDDYIARAFFTKMVVIVEGDTEEVVMRQALQRLERDNRDCYLRILSDFEILKARGKASIISLAKYLRSMGIEIFVMHDRDRGTPGAEVMNDPIKDAVGDDDRVIALEECIEDVLGYKPTENDKPYRAFKKCEEWGEGWTDVPIALRDVLSRIFAGYLPAVEAGDALVAN